MRNSGWDGIALASNAPSDRPAYSGTCYTNIYNKPIKVTQYNDVSIQASSIFTATDSLAQAYAYPYEGFAFGVAQLASTTASTTPASSSPTSAAPTASSTSTPAAAQTSSSSSATTSSSSSLSGGAIAGIVIGVLTGVALFGLALFAVLRYRRRRRGEGAVPPYEPEMQYHAQDSSAVGGGEGTNGMGGGGNGVDAMGVDKKLYPEGQVASEMEAKHVLQEMPEEPHRWHELESPPAAT
jgi:hypothetical protein